MLVTCTHGMTVTCTMFSASSPPLLLPCWSYVQILLQVQQMSSMPQQQQYKGLVDALRRIPQQEGGVRVRHTAAHTSAHQTHMPQRSSLMQRLHSAMCCRIAARLQPICTSSTALCITAMRLIILTAATRISMLTLTTPSCGYRCCCKCCDAGSAAQLIDAVVLLEGL
jgi:hypothetical protein